MIHHYITKYEEKGTLYAEAWMQIDLFGKAFCFSKRKIKISDYIRQIDVIKKSDESLVTRIFKTNGFIKEITDDDYEVIIERDLQNGAI